MADDLLTALCKIRWETPHLDELVVGFGRALRASRAVAVELGVGDEAWRADLRHDPPQVERIEARPIDEIERDGSGRFAGAERYDGLRLPTRHVSAYLGLWRSRSAPLNDAAAANLAHVLAMVVEAHVLVRRVASLSRAAHAEARRLRDDLRSRDEMSTASPRMRACLQRVDAVAPYDTAVLITGPSGSGKERLARRVHQRSPRHRGPFVQVNCGALPEALAESELFGHVRGAFTGAVAQHRGVFERASGGTLLLDEVGELSPATQAKLLRVLQEGTFTPVGAEASRKTDARIIAATHRDLRGWVRRGAFREDLYYRLAVFEVSVPSLRERPEDLPRLVRTIVAGRCQRMGREVPTIPRAVMQQLAAHDWPGNIRELENVLEGALVMSPGPRLELPPLRGIASESSGCAAAVQTLEQATAQCIETALKATRGKIYGDDGAAKRLGLKPGTLQSKMRKLGIDRTRFVSAQ